ncbi:MAG: hypothetical protein ACI4MM_09250 [Candidatus Ventricola sp.]
MNRNKKLLLACVLCAALLTLSGCDGMEDGTIDYVNGHWVFTNSQTEQSTDITQLMSNPDDFYLAASAMSDEELRRSFDLLSSDQCARIFRNLGEDRAMTLAGRLTQAQVERLLTILNGHEKVQSLSDPAALAAVWQTLTTDEQLIALGGLSSEDYAALWTLLGGAAPSAMPDGVYAEATAAPDMSDPVYLASIWHTLTQQEQSALLSRLTSAQFVSLWSLLDEQGSAAIAGTADTAQASEHAVDAEQTPTPAHDIEGAEQTPAPQESPSVQNQPSELSAAAETEQRDSTRLTDPAALADAWFTLSPEEQLSAIAALTADQFVSLQELLSVRPKPSPSEEDVVFIPTPKPTATRTPAPTATPAPLPDETEETEPDWSDPEYLAGIWHTLSPKEQLSILSALTIDQYIALQELLAQRSDSEIRVPDDPESAGDEAATQEPLAPDTAVDDTAAPADDAPAKDHDSDTAEDDAAAPADDAPAEDHDSDAAEDDAAAPADDAPAEDHDSDAAEDDAAAPADDAPAEDHESDAAIDGIWMPEGGQIPDIPGPLLPDFVTQPDVEATPSEGLPVIGLPEPSKESLNTLSEILKSTAL